MFITTSFIPRSIFHSLPTAHHQRSFHTVLPNHTISTPPHRRLQHRALGARCCTERPAWKKGPVDIDFAKDEQLEILETSLDRALSNEDFTQAAELHKKLTRLQSGSSVAVLSANLKFYHSLNTKSIVDIAGCWLQGGSPTCKHPGGPLVAGYINIVNSFGMLFTYDLPHMDVRNINIQMRGTVGYVTCQQVCEDKDEDGNPVEIKIFATNIYIKHNSQWYLTHHSSFVQN